MKPSLFRKTALDKLYSVEQLDQAIQITPLKSWIALAAVSGLLLMIVIWSFTGRIETKISGQGILLNTKGIYGIYALASGYIAELDVDQDDLVKEGQVIGKIIKFRDANSPETGGISPETVDIVSPHNGRIIEMYVDRWQVVERGAKIFILQPDDDELEATVYVSPTEGRRIRPGMKAQITPSTVQPQEYGFLIGEVKAVSIFPASKQAMLRYFQNEELVQRLSSGEAQIEVVVRLVRDENTKSGFKWSYPKGPPMEITPATLCSAAITVDEQRPIDFVLPVLKR